MTEETQTQDNSSETTQESPAVESNLEATIQTSSENVPPESETPVESTPSLFEETQAAMEAENRPEWLPEKFKTGEDLSKSYSELEKKLGAHAGAPEEYEMQLEEGLKDYAINSDDPFATDFAKVLKENGVNQKTYNEIVNLYFAKSKADEESIHDAQEQQFREDCKELGEDRVKEIKESIKWSKGMLSEESFELLSEIGDKDITVGKLIKEFHDSYQNKNYVQLPETDAESLNNEDLKVRAQEMMNDPKYSNDPVWRRKTDDLYRRLM